jgi:hypothetical protein
MKTPAFVLAMMLISGALSIAQAQTDPLPAPPSLAELAQKVVPAGKVLTNADLKPEPARPPVPFQRPVVRPEAIYEHYLANEREREQRRGPIIGAFGSPTAGPFGEFKPFDPPRRLDGTLLSDPPWGVTTFVPWSWWPSGTSRSPAPPPSGTIVGRTPTIPR